MQKRSWFPQCVMGGKKPWPVDTVANAIIALRNDPEVMGLLSYDAFEAMIKIGFPIGRPQDLFERPRDITDEDFTQIQQWLQHAGLKRIGKDNVFNACALVARDAEFHPVREWLESLEWDGQKRCNVWLITMLGAQPENQHQMRYLAEVGQMFLISMVARVFQPGCKVDHMLILEGPQRALKSSACRALATPWFSDALPDISSNPKDASMQLRGVWLLEIPELSAFNRAEQTQLKSFISRQVERYRPPFGRATISEPRQCCLIGTTNKFVYLKDETGGGRSWPVRVGRIDLDKLVAEREMLFAEALALYREETWWWPDPSIENLYIAPEQEHRFEGDPWEDAIAEYCADKTRVTTAEIATRKLFMKIEHVSPAVANRIGTVMRKLGWEAKNYRGRYWARPTTSAESTPSTLESP